MSITTVFAYKGFIGINSTPTDEGMVAPHGGGNIGVVMNANSVRFSLEALDLLKTIKVGKDAIGDVDVFMSGEPTFAWFGPHKRIISPKNAVAARGYNPSLLKVYDGEIEIPVDFKEHIDVILIEEEFDKIEGNI